ncbi:hypothetical protein ZIOFF_058872 [Zingiber officinale]|uniref:mitogen-activated protein kinase kinase kinase n=2 Tax=Zingiber officinale TaxID=94328 RepID=A0A8J5FC07_ZINOF|nr:hypothetical protein ZIOFF_058872 [Zingiber officinale]
MDVFVYFSHDLVTLSPPCWTNSAHTHGVQVLGTVLVEWDEGRVICDTLLSLKESSQMYAERLTELASALGFDGSLVRVEFDIDLGGKIGLFDRTGVGKTAFIMELMINNIGKGWHERISKCFDHINTTGGRNEVQRHEHMAEGRQVFSCSPVSEHPVGENGFCHAQASTETIFCRTANPSPGLKGSHSPSSSSSLSPKTQWKKGQLLGRGTFGHVYLGFSSESGQMCAIKEVKDIFDDANSKESLKQLNQEIVLLSQLSHPNIVQYYGSELVEDTLFILSMSGGSIHKILQEYGAFGETLIRNYTAQVLSGLAYLNGRTTVHRYLAT